jgi:hypothetical protein
MMYAHYQSGATTLTDDDVAGICAIDPPDGSRTTSGATIMGESCDPTPRHGFSTECASPTSGDAGGDEAGTGSSTGATKSSCAVASPGRPGRMDLATGGLTGLGLLVRRSHRRARRRRIR